MDSFIFIDDDFCEEGVEIINLDSPSHEALQEVENYTNNGGRSLALYENVVGDNDDFSGSLVGSRISINLNSPPIEALEDVTAIVQTTSPDNNTHDNDFTGSLLRHRSNKWENLLELYLKHSRVIGFGVRLGTVRRTAGPESAEYERYFVCSCQGNPYVPKLLQPTIISDDSEREPKKTSFSRTRCKAHVRVKLDKGTAEWVIIGHILEHNHPLTPVQWQHHHRSERKITQAEGEVIEVMTQAKVPPAVQFRFLAETNGGEDKIGHTKKDHFNFVNRLKMKAIEGGDAASLIALLSKRQSEDHGFFFRVKFDDENRLCNLFWRDSMMKEDYLLYHDVLIYDTTYCTNRYNLICSAFVGINNHRSNVIFGCAFLADEKTESFEWLFQTFNESMGDDVFPVSIFTDQDLAMANAIEKVYPNSRHRLCQWHIQQNAISHFGSLKHDRSFQQEFNKCLNGCYNEAEFEATWSQMITKYELQDDIWFKRLYGIRHKWCTALSKDFFSAGTLSSQRSESTNHAMGFRATKTTSLTDFYGLFQSTISRWRSDEERNEFHCLRSTPKSVYGLFGLLQHASQVYTQTMFRLFEQEFGYAMGTKVTQCNGDDNMVLYVVHLEGSIEAAHYVTFDRANFDVDCSCRKFQETGLLCFHSIRVLHLHSVSEIPNKYIMKRWTKFAKTEVWNKLLPNDLQRAQANENINWRRSMLSKYHHLILKCQDMKEAREILDKAYLRDMAEIQQLFTSKDKSSSRDVHTQTTVLDPRRSITKGRSQRKKRQSNKSKKMIRNNMSSDQPVVEQYTPVPRLI